MFENLVGKKYIGLFFECACDLVRIISLLELFANQEVLFVNNCI